MLLKLKGLIASCLVCVAATCWGSPQFTATDIGNLGDSWETVGTDINDSSQIVGYSHETGASSQTGFIWQSGTMTWDLWFDIVVGQETQQCVLFAISPNGIPVGYQQSFALVNHAVYYTLSYPATAHNIQGSSVGNLRGINSSDVAVGFYWNGSHFVPISYSGSTMTDLTTVGLSLDDVVYDINDNGDMCGQTGSSLPFYFHNGTRTVLSLPSGWTYGLANRVSNLSAIAGYLVSGSTLHAFISRPELPNSATQRLRDLGTLGGTSSTANDINNFGDAVGKSQVSGGAYHGFVWIDGSMYDLSSSSVVTSGLPSGSTVVDARAINNKREIVATVQVPKTGGGSETHTFILQPTSWW